MIMSRTNSASFARKYAGGNEHLERVLAIYPLASEEVWVVNASKGIRLVILPIGSTQSDAYSRYEVITA